jgi:multidrug efflux pump subunit AcrA (membrane-fusion protein)
MKRVIAIRAALVCIVVVALTAGVVACGGGAQQAAKYHCPMHPTYISDKPGDCPICGMRLVQVESNTATGERHEGRAVGGTPVAGGTPAAAPSAGRRKILFYRNPMNPTLTSPTPAQDEMGMDYVPVYAEEATPVGAAVPGLAAVQVTAEGVRLAGVQTEPARHERLERTIRAVGTVLPDETRIRHFHTRVTGWVEKLYVNFTGQVVRRGQPILSIYSPQLVATQEEFLRARDAATRFAASQFPEVRTGGRDLLVSARRRLELLDVPETFIDEIERTGTPQRTVTLMAHDSGYVTFKGVFEGQQVDPSMMDLFTITDLSRVWIEGDFYEYEARELHLGAEAKLTLPYEGEVRRVGRIAFVSPTLNPDSRTLRVRFEVDNPKLELKPGMFATVELSVDVREGLVIPDSAVIDTGERQVVFVSLGGGMFAPRQVTLGIRSNGKTEVLAGVVNGEQVAVRANFLLDSESQLRAAIAGGAAKLPTGAPR